MRTGVLDVDGALEDDAVTPPAVEPDLATGLDGKGGLPDASAECSDGCVPALVPVALDVPDADTHGVRNQVDLHLDTTAGVRGAIDEQCVLEVQLVARTEASCGISRALYGKNSHQDCDESDGHEGHLPSCNHVSHPFVGGEMRGTT